MQFPDSPRVKYRNNPLVEVICQLRFPKILRIEAEIPLAFQEAIRAEYPVFNTTQSVPLLIGISSVSQSTFANQSRAYEFVNQKGDWKISLTSDFISLSTVDYQCWEEFRERLSNVISVLDEHYSPPYFVRTGLRYQDFISRSQLRIENSPWQNLFKASLLGILTTNELKQEDIIESLSIFACRLDFAEAMVRVQHGTGQKEDTKEIGYLIDSDFFTDSPMETKDVATTLELFNQEAGRLFRWCITDELQQALEPEPVGE